MSKDDIYVMVQPGKNEGDNGSPFKDKADITILVTNSGGESLNTTCSKPSSDSSSEAYDYCIIEIESLVSCIDANFTVLIRVPQEETRKATIWQIHVGPLDDSKR